jgi:hypothetical protein
MSDQNEFSVNLGSIDYDRLITEEDYREVAWEKMPEALRQIGQAAGEAAWNSMKRAFRGPGMKFNDSPSERRKFIESAAQEFCEQNIGNKEIEEHLISQLRENKAKLDAGQSLD